MASLKINDLNVAGMNLFPDRESYLDKVADRNLTVIKGGDRLDCTFANGLEQNVLNRFAPSQKN